MKLFAKNKHSILLLGILLMMSLGQLVRFSITPFIAVSVFDVALLTHLTWLFFTLKKESFHRKELLLSLALLTIFGLSWLPQLVNNQLWIPGIAKVIRLGAYVLWAILVIGRVKKTAIQTNLIAFFASYSWLSIIQLLLMRDLRWLAIFGWDDHLNRVIGPLFDPNFSGVIFVIGALVSLFLYATKATKLPKKIPLFLFFTQIMLLFFTFSRSGYLAILGGLIWLFPLLFSRKKLPRVNPKMIAISFFTLIFTGISFILLQQGGGAGTTLTRTFSAVARYQADAAYLTQMDSFGELLFGKGMFNRAISIGQGTAQQPNNFVVNLIWGTGTLGITLISATIWYFRSFIEKMNSWQLAIVVSLLIHALFNASLFHPVVLTVGILSLAVLQKEN